MTHEAVDLTSADEVEALWDRLERAAPRWVVNAVGGVPRRAGRRLRARRRSASCTTSTSAPRGGRAARPRGGSPRAARSCNVARAQRRRGGAGSAAYTVAKAGVVRLTEVLADDLAERRVRVNAVLPSVIDTPANRAVAARRTRSRRRCSRRELAAVVAFLCSDAASAVTGAIVPVYGWA